MKVSIVIPAYNEEAYLAAALTASLAQDYPDFEVIVVDNASTDRTPEIARSFPVKLVHETTKGVGAARERGRQEASGEIIASMDGDCTPDRHWLSRGVACFTRENVVAVSGPYDYTDAAVFLKNLLLAAQRLIFTPANVIAQNIGAGAILIGGNNFIRSRALAEIGGFNTAMIFYGEDTDTAKRIARTGKVRFNGRVIMKTSARRLQREGVVKIIALYVFHFFHVIMKRTNKNS